MRWVHSTELADPTPWLKGGELLLTHGHAAERPEAQRELIDRLADHEIAGLGFGTGFTHKRLPAALVKAARKREFPLFEVPYELPFIAITERAFAQLLNERYEMLQRNMAGDVLAEALTGHLYPEDAAGAAAPVRDRRAGRPCWPSRRPTRPPRRRSLERILEREGVPSLVAIRGGLLCAVVRRLRDSDRAGGGLAVGAGARRSARSSRRASARCRRGGEPRRPRTRLAAAELPRGALRARGGAPAATATRPRSPPTRTSAPSSCCCRCRTTTR